MAYIDEAAFRNVEERDRFTRSLLVVETAGGIVVQRKRIDGVAVFGHVRLASPAILYAQLARTPASQRADAVLNEARARTDLPGTVHNILDDIAQAWSRNVSRFGLAPEDGTGLAASLDLARALAVRADAGGAAPVDYRTFSRTAGADSKALERLVSTVPKLFERLYPDRASPDVLIPEDWLATLGVLRTPQPLTVGGPITIAGQPLPPLRFYGVPPEQGDQLGLAARVAYMLTIENFTSFVRHVREINDDRSGLIIYTGGFPSRGHLRQIVRLAEEVKAPSFHWGDLDGGGVRIFQHLERAIASRGLKLRPHLMDAATLLSQGIASERQLRSADAPPSESAIRDLWDALSESGLALEQETLSPQRPEASG
ncbi:MAG TPA: Wadjet anti-phage system protein JetD domain-containing protein [Croceibacterium sp.]